MSEPSPKRPSDELLPIGRAPFIGRVAERAAVRAAVQRSVREGRCEVVTLVGAAGVGKSRFVDELVADLAVDEPMLRVFRGAARDDRGAHAAIATILRARFKIEAVTDAHAQANEVCAQVMDLFGDRRVDEILHFLGVFLGMRFGATLLAEAFLEDPRASEHVARAVLRRLFEVDAQRSPLLLVVEDAHLAGADGVRLLRSLVEGLRAAPVTVLFTTRPELLASAHDFCATPAGRHLRVDLAPLDEGEATVMARALLSTIENVPGELVRKAVALGGGNPLLIRQIVRIYFDQGVIAVDDEGIATIDLDRLERISLPMSVEDAATSRITALAPSEMELLKWAAMMGRVFWVGGLVVLGRTGREPPALWGGGEDLALQYRDTLKGLVERGYVSRAAGPTAIDDEAYAFNHDLDLERLAALVPSEDAEQLHLVLAEWLEFRLNHRGEEQLDMLARQYERGRRPLRAARCYLTSADLARERYANAKAVEHYALGLSMLGEHDIGLRLDAHHHQGDVLAMLGRGEEALVHFQKMLRLAYRLDLKAKGGAAHNRIGRLYRDAGKLDDCMRHLGTALALFEAAGDEKGIAASFDDIGKTHWLRGAYETALRFLQDGLVRREAQGDKRSIALSWNNIGLVFQDSGQYKAAYDALMRARDLRREAGDLPGLVVTLNNLGTIHSDRGEDHEAITIWKQALELAQEVGDRRRQAVLLLNMGEARCRMRDVDEALRILTEVEQQCRELGDRLLLAEARRGLGKAHFLNNDLGEARRFLEDALGLFEQVRSKVHVAVAQRSLAEVLAAYGAESEEGKRAESLFRKALAAFEALGAELELARTARTFADFLSTSPVGVVPESAFAEAEAMRVRSDEIYARLHADTAVAGRDRSIRGGTTDPGIQRVDLPPPGGRDRDRDLTPPDGVPSPGARGR
jgi:tetratricopeptide (TPR) repeat protein